MRRRRAIIAIIGAGELARRSDVARARTAGRLIAARGWILLTGGRDAGVMRAATRGAKEVAGSLTVGILPSPEVAIAPGVDVAIITDLGSGRNNVNVLTANAVIACGVTSAGTLSEVALALKAARKVIVIAADEDSRRFLSSIGEGRIHFVDTPEAAIDAIERELSAPGRKSEARAIRRKK
jgi:uncharacterized protein (TIGR00725 family)